MIVPTARGIRWAAILLTSGEATAAMIEAVITGITIVCVSASSVTSATASSAIPTSSQDMIPMSRSQPGARKTPVSSAGSISMRSSAAAGGLAARADA